MLIVRELDITRGVVNSEGEKVSSLGSSNYVVLYDNKIVSENALKNFVDDIDEISDSACMTTNNIVVLPADVWRKLHDMIAANYKIEER